MYSSTSLTPCLLHHQIRATGSKTRNALKTRNLLREQNLYLSEVCYFTHSEKFSGKKMLTQIQEVTMLKT